MPGGDIFIDTNVLLYAREIGANLKSERAKEWLGRLAETQRARLNLQVLNELASVLFRKRRDLEDNQVFAAIDELLPLGSTSIDTAILGRARTLRRRYRYSWWDCLLLASAINLGCSHFLSEDLQDGHAIEGLTIVDPFAHTPDEILAAR